MFDFKASSFPRHAPYHFMSIQSLSLLYKQVVIVVAETLGSLTFERVPRGVDKQSYERGRLEAS